MLDADKAINAWAAKKIGVHPDTIVGVDFGHKQAGYCDTCSYTVSGVEVSYRKKDARSTSSEFISLDYYSFASILEEILEEGKNL